MGWVTRQPSLAMVLLFFVDGGPPPAVDALVTEKGSSGFPPLSLEEFGHTTKNISEVKIIGNSPLSQLNYACRSMKILV